MAVHAPRKPNSARRKRKAGGPPAAESAASTPSAAVGRPDPLASTLYAQLSTRPLVDIVRVYRELQHRFAFAPDDEQQAWCVDALLACKAERGSVSANQYERFWNALPDRSVWPSQAVIRRTFGSWTSARATIEPVGEFRALTGSRQRVSMTAEGLLDTICVWLDELGQEGRCNVMRLQAFLSWCRSRLSDPAYGHLELPTSKRPIEKHLGGWIEALRLAGAHERAEELLTTRMRPFDAFSDEELLTIFGRAIDLWDEVPSYNSYCEGVRSGAYALPDLPLPPGHVVVKRFQGWNAALIKAGALTAEDVARRTYSRRERISTEFALQMLCDAIEAEGPTVGRARYRAWRYREIDRHGKGPQTPPSDAWICDHFGTFERGRDLALAELAVKDRS